MSVWGEGKGFYRRWTLPLLKGLPDSQAWREGFVMVLPALFADHQMHNLSVPCIRSIGVFDVIYPMELLPPVGPILRKTIFFLTAAFSAPPWASPMASIPAATAGGSGTHRRRRFAQQWSRLA